MTAAMSKISNNMFILFLGESSFQKQTFVPASDGSTVLPLNPRVRRPSKEVLLRRSKGVEGGERWWWCGATWAD